MRIVGGALKGRKLAAPIGEGTRPTSDRVREAVMSSLVNRLGADLGGGVVLDLFAGSGALAFESLSRGAARAVLVEKDRAALKVIAENTKALGLTDRVTVFDGDALAIMPGRFAKAGPFTLLFVDPPYRIDSKRVVNRLLSLGAAGAIADGAAVAWEHSAGGAVPEPDGFAQERTYRYGDTSVTLLRYYGEGRVE
ncbi:MAG TPA: 16S rRNA (guanine(966)-N(2))-methyltransferase RsmD [Coriobacteriia bacterium]